MPRAISPTSLATIAQRTGLEPLNVIRIRWIAGGQYHYYADRKIQEIEGKLLSLDGLEAVLDISNSSSSTSVKIKLNDEDGSIKNIFDNNDINGAPVAILQWFSNISLSDAFVVFDGVISTPITWSEGERTVEFDVLSKLDDRSVGFSVEDGDFKNVPEIILGKAWPLIFGTVKKVPVLQMDEIPTGTTKIPIGIPDENVSRQTNYIEDKNFGTLSKATCLSMRAAELMFIGQFMGGGREVFERGQSLQRQARDMVKQCSFWLGPEFKRFDDITKSQKDFDVDVIPIINGRLFLQGVEVEIKINRASYTGTFHGDNFTVKRRVAFTEASEKEPGGKVVPSQRDEFTLFSYQESTDQKVADLLFGSEEGDTPSLEDDQAYWSCEPPWHHDPQPTKDNLSAHEKKEFFFANAGSSVTVGSNYPIRYILSISPDTTVIALYARTTVKGVKVLNEIPRKYYTISNLHFGSITAKIATLTQPLSTIEDHDWDDDIYADMKSSIGPNVVEILTWIINHYTDFSIDTASFAYVQNKLAKYPANFALLDKKNVTELLKEIAWQARCAIWAVDRVFYLKYLPEPGTIIDDLNEDDIEANSMSVTTTPDSDIVTRIVASWKKDYSTNKDNLIILNFNVPKYGRREANFNFYIYNQYKLVVKAATFWLLRLSNTWKILECKTFLNKLTLETMDSVNVNFVRPYVANQPVTGVVQKATFNSDDFSIDMQIWLPVRLGEMTPYLFAYPANISVTAVFPTDKDIAGHFDQDSLQERITGNLEGRFNIINVSDIKNTKPADDNDQLEIQTITSGYNTTQNAIDRPRYDYRNDPHQIPSVPPAVTASTATFAGFLTTKTAPFTYDGVVYTRGIGNPATQVRGITVLGTNDKDISGTWGFVVKYTQITTNTPIAQYYFQPTSTGATVFPAQVLQKTGTDIYTMKVYMNGKDKPPTNIPNVKQLFINPDETIPPEIWTYVFSNAAVNAEGVAITEWTMQVPVFG